MMETEQLWEAIDARAKPLAPVRVPLDAARGLVLAEDLLAGEDMPPFDRSAMDGYVVSGEEGAAAFRVVGEIRPGEPPRGLPGPGCAARIFTGGAVPPGGCVVMQESVSREGDLIRLGRPAGREHVRPRGSDAREGDLLLTRGTRLGPGEIAVLAACGRGRPRVHPWPRVAHAVTGDELVGPEETPGPGQVRDSNGPLIRAMLSEEGVREVASDRWRDDPVAFGAGLGSAPFAAAQLLLVSGGSSAGDRDFTRVALERAGFEIHCSRVNSRPGRPLLFASRGQTLAFGLPGNPLSHFVVFHLFVARALARLCGRSPRGFHPALLDAEVGGQGEGGPSVRACRLRLEEGRLRATPVGWHNSGHVSALAGVSGLLRAPVGAGSLARGDRASALPTGPLP